jgi:hypothetical protein
MGPAVPFLDTLVALAPVGDPSEVRKNPVPWVPAAEVFLVGDRGTVGTAGEIFREEGLFKTWLNERLVLGTSGDTLFTFHLSSAILRAYTFRQTGGPLSPVKEILLPRYFVAPEPIEEVFTYPWIEEGGDRVKLVQVSHAGQSTFGAGGRLFAIRNYRAEWKDEPDPFFTSTGNWIVVSRGMEVYDSDGHRLGAFALPVPDPDWIRADSRGRLLISHGDSLFVIPDPTSWGRDCPPFPRRILNPHVDLPSRSAGD